MTSGDGPTVPAFYPLVTPNDQPHDVSQASSCSRNTCNGQKLSDLGRILDHPDPNEQASNGNRQAAVVSQGSLEEADLKEVFVCEMVQSAREGSSAEDGEAQIIDNLTPEGIQVS